MNFISPKKSYFAAANGFTGFRSYFNRTFNPKDFTRLFIIKGGPGTGKSTLMKRLISDFCKSADDVHAIYCSSDPKSLDGVILKFGNKSFAVLDGTAPHATDAAFPGAVDEIINLGEFWDENRLFCEREKIIEINENKKRHYKSAYEFLRISGDFFERRRDLMKKAFSPSVITAVNSAISDLGNLKLGRSRNCSLITSFGKDGIKRIFDGKYEVNGGLSVSGIFGSEYLFLSHLESECIRRSFEMTALVSPFSDTLTEGLYFRENDCLVLTNSTQEKVLKTEELLNGEYIEKHLTELNAYEENFNAFLALSKEEFKLASDEHFKLEKIYASAMNFEKIDTQYELLKEKIIRYM